MKTNIISDCRNQGIDSVIQQIFKDRKITDPEHFLNPTEDDMLPLEDLENIHEAAQILLEAIEYNRTIGLSIDVDLDGITSGTIIYRYLKSIAPDVKIIPFINEGKVHGLQKDDLDKYKKCNLLIIVDSLDPNAFNYEEVQKYSDVTDIIVLDHHTVNPKVPYDKWVTLVTSQRNYGNKALSGAGVCMKFVLYLDKLLETDYAEDLYDLACAGLIADMMDVTVPENRYLISRGLEEIHNPAIQKLSGGFDWNAKNVSFSIAPCVNASMRLNKNEYSMMAFLSDGEKEVNENVRVLKKCKKEQNKEIDSMMADIIAQCNKQLDKKMMVIHISTENGIAGLVGNRILSIYERPIVILKDEGEKYFGSMRAVGVDDFQKMINESGLGKAFGHELAAGVEIEKKNLPKFVEYMEEHLPDVGSFEETITADIWARPQDITKEYISKIEEINRISGTGFKPVCFYLDGITDYEIDSMGQGKHLVVKLNDCDLTLFYWNFKGNWNEYQDAALFGYELECVVELQKGFLGRNYYLQGIVQWMRIKD